MPYGAKIDSSQSLLYVKGGGAWVDDRWDLTNALNQSFQEAGGGFNTTRFGWTIGGGWEWAFAPNWSVFVEYNHYDFGSHTIVSEVDCPCSLETFSAKQRIEAVTVGVNYRFNWSFGKGKAPNHGEILRQELIARGAF